MRSPAIVVRGFGGPEMLVLEDLELPPLAPTDVRIRMLAAAVNHSDLEVRAGAWKIRRTPQLPYVPGLEVVGEIVEVGRECTGVELGDHAITMMQGLGGVRAERDGGYQQLVTVDHRVVAIVPPALDPIAVAAVGLAGVTAQQGLDTFGAIAGKRVAITGAAGGVGSLAVALAAARGAKVVAIARDPSRKARTYLESLGAAEVVAEPATLAPASLHAALDVITGALFEPLIAALADGGQYCAVGAMGGDHVSFSAWELLRSLTLRGYSSETLDGDRLRAATGELFALLARGALPTPEHTSYPLAHAADAHRALEAGGVRGRIVLVP